MKITVKNAEQTWQSPDGQRTIWRIVFENDAGTNITRKTFSKTISQPGWTGEVMEYTKGTDVYVKQPPKEGYENYGNNQQAMPIGGAVSPELVSRLEAVAVKLEKLVTPKPDVTLSLEEGMAILGGEVVDDL